MRTISYVLYEMFVFFGKFKVTYFFLYDFFLIIIYENNI